ncbi:LPXTG cell wall anchor domain-containing protein [Amycolatopsis sp. NPDC057786]|uniref:LPXTG cell wall anchor domain-containing protein n=1 Tax=Amycolatopsis sp. NPDC057786 TaxID=3346250 RepID=UPI00367101FD
MQIKPRRRVRSAVTVVALATAALLGTAGTALATRSDDRATQVVGSNATTCEGAKVPGKLLPTSDLTVTGGNGDLYLDITAVAKGVTVTAIVVKGGHGYNVYVPGEKGLPENPPWTQLRSPLNKGDQQAAISHWFVCGEKKTPTSEPTKPGEPTKTTTAKPPTSAPATTDKPSQTSEAPSSSTTAPAPAVDGNGGNGGGLADTGFDNAWLLWAGGLLVLAGAGVLVLLRVRRGKAN